MAEAWATEVEERATTAETHAVEAHSCNDTLATQLQRARVELDNSKAEGLRTQERKTFGVFQTLLVQCRNAW